MLGLCKRIDNNGELPCRSTNDTRRAHDFVNTRPYILRIGTTLRGKSGTRLAVSRIETEPGQCKQNISNLSHIAVTKKDNLECLARVLVSRHEDSFLAVVIETFSRIEDNLWKRVGG